MGPLRKSGLFGRASFILCLCIAASGITTNANAAEKGPTAAQLLKLYSPRQPDIDYETPTGDELAKCQVNIEKRGKVSGYVVLGSAGQVLRRFDDTNGDNEVDQFRYYNHGIEVYREADTNFNKKVDQYRWVNMGGSRWGVDSNEDGRIESWKALSASEASREAVQAMITGDIAALESVMLTEADARTLGLNPEISQKLLESSSAAPKKAQAIAAKSKMFQGKPKWQRFDALMPSMIPSDDDKAKVDLLVYENAMAIVETAGNQSAFVQIGEMIRVGEVWKLTQAPTPMEGNAVQVSAGGILMQPLASATENVVAGPAPSAAAQKLLEELQALDKAAPAPGANPDALTKFNGKRADLLMQLVSASESEEEREQWMRQMVDGIAAATQAGGYAEGLTRLASIETSVRKSSPKSPMVGYVAYRRLLAEYSVEMQSASQEKRTEIQKAWLKNLEEFIGNYPNTEDTADAMLQLAIAEEFNNKAKEAMVWYQRLAKEKSRSIAGARAAGAIRRIELKGKPLKLAGPSLTGGNIDIAQLRGKVTVVLFWATWCQPCLEDLPQMRALYQQYKAKGLEVVGVCLDVDKQGVDEFIAQHKIPWPHIFQPGGFESPVASDYGIITLPTVFVVDREGRVASRGASLQDLKAMLPEMLQGK